MKSHGGSPDSGRMGSLQHSLALAECLSSSQLKGVVEKPLRLISLREACLRRGISVRSYWRDTSQLPLPVKGKGKHLFLEQEVDALIDRLLSARLA